VTAQVDSAGNEVIAEQGDPREIGPVAIVLRVTLPTLPALSEQQASRYSSRKDSVVIATGISSRGCDCLRTTLPTGSTSRILLSLPSAT